ncbi:hypothetical protein MASR2M47_34380 [Draconibacterium sp.]
MNKQMVFLFLCLTSLFSQAQTIENWIVDNEKFPVEKIYIHTDAENYFTGDTVWFKAYLIDSRSGKLIPSAENLYISLLDASGTSVLQLVLLCVNGQASGSFAITEKMKIGNFMLQAYTNYLFNFTPDSHFYKQITVSRVSGFSGSSVFRNRTENMVADVAFLPEGGVLLENASNLVAFKAISKLGYGVNASGTVKDEKGLTVATFSTDYKGMGLFFLTPEIGKTYWATVEGFPSFKYRFEAVKVGSKIQLVNHTSKEAIVNISVNSEELSDEVFYIANFYRGEVLFYQAFQMNGVNKVFKFDNSSLKPGINKLVLLDKTLTPVSERLLFSRNFELNNLLIQPDSKFYNRRSEIQLQINDEKYMNEDAFSNLSVSVVHEFAVPEKGFSKNILSSLLIDSEINGFVESSADLFTGDGISSEAKLRLVMLTHGYGNYFWDSAPNKTTDLKYKQESGISLKGAAKNTLTGNVIANGQITIAVQKEDELAFLTQTTDDLGNFIFPGLLFNDTATIHVQGKNEAGKMNMDVVVEPVFKSIEASEINIGLLSELPNVPPQLAGLKYQISVENKKFQLKNKSIAVKSKSDENIEEDGHFRLYESADFVLEVKPFEQSYSNVLDYMVGKVPGVDINGDDVRIRGASGFGNGSLPLFLIDGVPLAGNQTINVPAEVSRNSDGDGSTSSGMNDQLIQTVRAIPISDVEKIEVLKSPQNLSVFGVKGANGVIAIYTKRGKPSAGNLLSKNIIKNKVVGYAKFRQFYSPKYTPENVNDIQPDLKTLLYWNSEVKTVEGVAKLQFFSSDQPGKYIVIVEGIANDGKICLGRTELEVN